MASPAPDTTAAEKVFSVTELLEAIILDLSMSEIAQAQRVCKQWKSVIDFSSPLKRALFLEPGCAADTRCEIIDAGGVNERAKHPAFSLCEVGMLATAGRTSALSRMYLYQPPSFMEATEYQYGYTFWLGGAVRIPCEAGETFGSLLEKIKQAKDRRRQPTQGLNDFWSAGLVKWYGMQASSVRE